MPNDRILTRSFFGEAQPSIVTYHHDENPRRFRMPSLKAQAQHLRTIFPWLSTSDWHEITSNYTPQNAELFEGAMDGIFLLPRRAALLRGGRSYHNELPSYNALLDITIERMRAVLPRVDIHIGSCDPCHIIGHGKTPLALEYHEGLFPESDICPIVTQLGRMHQGDKPWEALKHFPDKPIFEFGADPARVGIILAMHHMEHGYLPDMDVECPGAAYDFRGAGKIYDDCPRWHAEKGSYLALDWNYGSRARPSHGTASMFIKYPTYRSPTT